MVSTERLMTYVQGVALGLIATLFWGATDPTNRWDAVRQTSDQALLAKAVLDDIDPVVRRIAAENQYLTDQAVLEKVVLEDKDSDVRCAAARKLTDQSLLAKLAAEDKDAHVRGAAVSHLSHPDQTLVAKLVVEDEDSSVRNAAIFIATDETLLKLTDHAIRVKIAEDMGDDRLIAQDNIADSAPWHSAKHAAVRLRLFLTDPVIQGQLGATTLRVTMEPISQDYTEIKPVRMPAGTFRGERVTFTIGGGNLKSEQRETWSTDFPEDGSSLNGYTPVKVNCAGLVETLLKDFPQTKLAQVALENADPVARNAAVEGLTDQSVLVKLAAVNDAISVVAQQRLDELRKSAPK